MVSLFVISQVISSLVMAAQLLLGLAILIILHEGGHFLAARLFGIRVEKFYLFFDAWGVKLFHFKKGDTEYGIGWLPLGGYVKIAGMIDESMDKEQMALPPKPDEFRSKPAWQRLIVMLAGVTVNLFLGILIFWILTLSFGQSYIPMSEFKDGIVPGQAFKEIGIQAGDKILKAGGKPVERESDLRSSEVLYGNIDLEVLRQGKLITIHVPANFAQKLSDKPGAEFLFVPRIKPVIDSVIQAGGAQKAGLRAGDQIIGFNDQKLVFFDELQESLSGQKGRKVKLDVLRGQQLVRADVQLDTAGKIGFFPRISGFKSETEHFGFFPSLQKSFHTAFGFVGDQAKALTKIAKGEITAKQISGPVGIAKIYGGRFEWFNFWRLTGALSMILAFMNLLPIPALDGGHVLFLLIEMVKGRPLSDKFLENAQMVGFFILIGLMVFVFGNDIVKLVVH